MTDRPAYAELADAQYITRRVVELAAMGWSVEQIAQGLRVPADQIKAVLENKGN